MFYESPNIEKNEKKNGGKVHMTKLATGCAASKEGQDIVFIMSHSMECHVPRLLPMLDGVEGFHEAYSKCC